MADDGNDDQEQPPSANRVTLVMQLAIGSTRTSMLSTLEALSSNPAAATARLVIVKLDGGSVTPATDNDENNSDNDNDNATLTEEDLMNLFRGLCQRLDAVRELRVEWNEFAIFYDDWNPPPFVPLRVLEHILLTNTVALDSLVLYRCKLSGSDADYERLARALQQRKQQQQPLPSLKRVRLEFCDAAGDRTLDDLLGVLFQIPTLEHLELLGSERTHRGWTHRSLGTPLSHSCPTLKSLKVWGGFLEADTVVHLLRGITGHPSLQELDLGSFPVVTLEVGNALAGVIRNQDSQLEQIWLHVDDQFHPDYIAKPMAQALQNNKTLECCHVHAGKPIGPSVLEPFRDVLQENMTIRHLTIRGPANNTTAQQQPQPEQDEEGQQDEATREILDEIKFYLRLNRAGRRNLLSDTTSREGRFEWLSTLFMEKENVSVLFYLLVRNPAFIAQCIHNVESPLRSKRQRHAEPDCGVSPSKRPRRL